MVRENSRPSESALCLLCRAGFDDGKCFTVLSKVKKMPKSRRRFHPE